MTEELPHIRCIECGKVLANKWNDYQNLLSQGVPIEKALNTLGLTRYCCRFRMMNPFKTPIRSEQQVDPRDIGLEKQMETLTMATGNPAPVLDPLQAMTQATPDPTEQLTPAYTVVPVDPTVGGIDLPAIPEVAVPAIPAPGAEIVPEKPGNIIRSYQAW